MSDDGFTTVEQRRKLFLQASGRSYSAPPRKKWFKRNPLRRMESQQSMLYDTAVSRRLVGAIAAWHDLHSKLLQLSSDKKSFEESSDRGTTEETGSTCSPSSDDKFYSSQDSLETESWREEYEFSENEEGEDGNETDETIEEMIEFNKNERLNGKLSLSNPELTSIQLKHMFPELSEHWR